VTPAATETIRQWENPTIVRLRILFQCRSGAGRGVLSSRPHLGSRDVMLTPFPRGSLLSSLPFFAGAGIKGLVFQTSRLRRAEMSRHLNNSLSVKFLNNARKAEGTMHVPSPFLDIAGNFPAIFTLGQLNVVGAAYCIRTTAAGRLFSSFFLFISPR